eukprot:TRINITY_DN3013_c1_g1_i1.p1 TRINITY_DN3013_c1_g1~~TRINITY_DN3013_c1_g1_i1.p1  ORF type:complete len:573 (+),score=80.14 TRINITY_DN3013_c1_g1_i1:77-1795(+)
MPLGLRVALLLGGIFQQAEGACAAAAAAPGGCAAGDASSLLQKPRRSAPAHAPTPHLDAVEAVLRRLAPKAEGKLWRKTRGNSLQPNGTWLLTSPNCWGHRDMQKACVTHGAPGALALAKQIEDVIASAEEWVDIATLAYPGQVVPPHPGYIAGGIFHDAIVAGMQRAYARNPQITFRLICGAPVLNVLLPRSYLNELLVSLGPDVARGARIFVAKIRTDLTSWNHAKIVAADGKSAIVGGHNLWPIDYNGPTPVNDVSMRLDGPGAIDAHGMANVLWHFACEHLWDATKSNSAYSPAVKNSPCPARYAGVQVPASGEVSALALGEMGLGMDPIDDLQGALPPANDPRAACTGFPDYFNCGARYSVDNPSQAGRLALIDSAKKSIFLAQQDLLFDMCDKDYAAMPRYDARLFQSLAEKLRVGVKVTIVVSTPKSNGPTGDYSFMNNLKEIPQLLLRNLRNFFDETAARAVLCGFLRLASVRLAAKMPSWPGTGVKIGQHAKVIAVDDAAFYIGSHNLYPTPLQEFGYIVEDSNAASDLNKLFLDKLWHYSEETAIVDQRNALECQSKDWDHD